MTAHPLVVVTIAGSSRSPTARQAEVWKPAGDEWDQAWLTPRVRGIFQRMMSFRR